MWSSVSKFHFPWTTRCYLILVLKFSQFCKRACGIAKPTFEKWRNRAKLFFVTRNEMSLLSNVSAGLLAGVYSRRVYSTPKSSGRACALYSPPPVCSLFQYAHDVIHPFGSLFCLTVRLFLPDMIYNERLFDSRWLNTNKLFKWKQRQIATLKLCLEWYK